MTTTGKRTLFVFLGTLLLSSVGLAGEAFAHCDGMDGPVVKAAQQALESGKVNLVLIWVQKKDEAEVIRAFEKSRAVRRLSPEAKELADVYFFETAVRLHRAGEGEPFTGLKTAGRDLGPAIPAADAALERGSVDPLFKLIMSETQDGIRQRFNHATALKNFRKDDVEAGREYVKAYVLFIHYVERLYEAIKDPVPRHDHTSEIVRRDN